ncbi:MAG: class I SAM-dependent methyltransferase [Smithella sp.]
MSKDGTAKFEYEERSICICGQTLKCASVDVIQKHYTWGNIKFIRCNVCGSWCQSPQLTLDSLSNWFNSADYQGSSSSTGIAYVNYINDEESRIKEAQRRYARDLWDNISPGARVLEIGCATGSLLSVLHDNGCIVTGLDLSSKFVEVARELYGLNIILGDVFSVDLPKKYFDAIILLGTIGNLQNITKYLNKFSELLVDNGLLIFNFVDANSPIVKYLYRSKFWMFTPSINCFMTHRGCEAVLKQSGFSIKSIKSDMQKPSLQKLFNHARLTAFLPLINKLWLGKTSLPISLPIPSVKLVKALCLKV